MEWVQVRGAERCFRKRVWLTIVTDNFYRVAWFGRNGKGNFKNFYDFEDAWRFSWRKSGTLSKLTRRNKSNGQ